METNYFLTSNQSKEDFVNIKFSPQIKGFPFPINENNERGFFYRAVDHEVIKADLLQLLLTEPGERVMMPSFGTGLRRSIFERLETVTLEDVKQIISNSIRQWEPRIVVHDISVNIGEDDNRLNVGNDNLNENSIIVGITYSLKENMKDIEKLEFRVNYKSPIAA